MLFLNQYTINFSVEHHAFKTPKRKEVSGGGEVSLEISHNFVDSIVFTQYNPQTYEKLFIFADGGMRVGRES